MLRAIHADLEKVNIGKLPTGHIPVLISSTMPSEPSSSSESHHRPIHTDTRTYQAGVSPQADHTRGTHNVPFFNIHEPQTMSSGLWPNGGRVHPAPVLDIEKYSA